MKSLIHLKDKALKLREKNLDIDTIAKMLSIGRTTIYTWVKDIPITKTTKQTLAQQIGSAANKEKHKKIRESYYQQGIEEYNKLKNNITFKDFIMIYLTEGYRKNKNVVDICNSNPRIIKLSYYWMSKLKTEGRKFDFSVQIHEDQYPEEIKNFWASILKINKEEIKIFPKSNSGKLKGRNWRSEFGVLNLRLNDTYFRSKIQAYMDKLEESWEEIYK